VGVSDAVHIYYPFHAYAGFKLKSRQQWRVSKDCIIVELADGSRLKLPGWMTSTDAAHFEISESPAVNVEGLKDVCELLEISQKKEQNRKAMKQVILNGKEHKPKEGKANESASALDKGRRKNCQVRKEYRSGVIGNHGRSNSCRDSGKKGGKR
jgi:hypothetical protein